MCLRLFSEYLLGFQYLHCSRISHEAEPLHRYKEQDGGITKQRLSGREAGQN